MSPFSGSTALIGRMGSGVKTVAWTQVGAGVGTGVGTDSGD